jgi:hypothetical protein
VAFCVVALELEAWEPAEFVADWSALLCANAGAAGTASAKMLAPRTMSFDLISLFLSSLTLHV